MMTYNNSLMTVSKRKFEGWFDNIEIKLNSQLKNMLNNKKDDIDNILKTKKYIYMYHRYQNVSLYILNNKDRFGYKVIIHDPLHCGFTLSERNLADRISCWSKDFIINRINDNHNKLFTMILPRYSRNILEDNINNREPYIISVGNTCRDFQTLINALDGIDIKCIILTNNTNDLKNTNSNIIIKSVPLNDVNEYMKYASFGVLPLNENTGRGCLNPQAHGITVASQYVNSRIPFIISKDRGVDEYLEDGVFGEYYIANDKDSLREKIIHFMNKDVQDNYKGKINKFYNDNPKHLSPEHFIETLEYQFSIC
jgi:hypothetical protein